MAGKAITVRKLQSRPAVQRASSPSGRYLAHDALFARLRGNDVVCAARGDMRFSPHCYAPLQQLDRAVVIGAG